MKPVLIDLFSCQGGASKGYADAGFEVIGVDIEPQPRYPFEFIQGDAIALLPELVERYNPVAVAGSPPCQARSGLRHRAGRDYVELVPPTRKAMEATGLPYVIENVETDMTAEELGDAALRDPLLLCGSMFDLYVDHLLFKRHRLFETNFPVGQPAHDSCRDYDCINVHGGGGQREVRNPGGPRNVHGNKCTAAEASAVMKTPWMTQAGRNQAIPPVYAEYVGRQLMAHLSAQRAA